MTTFKSCRRMLLQAVIASLRGGKGFRVMVRRKKKKKASLLPLPQRVGIGLTQALAAHAFGVTLDDLRSCKRAAPRAAIARQVAMYLSYVVFKLSMPQIAEGFGRDRATARHACDRVEKLRNDRDFDRALTWLIALMRTAAENAS
jgi:chromosomal replication initiation ATPase DnaA